MITTLVEQVADGEHNLIGGGGALHVLIGSQVALAIDGVVGVLALAIREQGGFADLLVEAPVLAEEVGQVHDVDT